MLTEQLKLMAIEQSTRQLQYKTDELEGVVNQLLEGSEDMRRHGLRLQQLHSQIGQELKNIGYVIQQGQAPVAEQQLTIGQKVQEAVSSIDQV
ncbi:MAG: hypothetical protein ACXVP5_04445 [Tumebacillaceae bacterium]